MADSRRFQTRVLCVALYVGLLSCCQAVQVTDRVFQWIRNPENYTTDGVRLTGSVLKTVYMRYVMIQCAFECLREPECRSFNWYPLNHCQLNSASHLAAPDNMTQDVRYEYHLRDAFSIDQEALGPCSGNPCGTHGQCMETMSADLDLQAICICDIGWRGSKCDLPEAAPQWGEWGVWASCSVSCGLGVTSRRRPCEDVITNVSIDVRECYGADVEFKSCTEPACPRWGVWGAWGSCSTETTCGQGVKVRTRNCTNGGTAGVDRYCLGPTNQTSPCSAMDCRGLLRLVSGFQPGEGRLEVFSDVTEQWGGVCSAALTPATADLVCRQLGFPGAFQATADLRFGAPAGMPFGLTSLTCRGGERSLLECAHNTWSQAASCPDGTSTPAGVLCNVDGSWTLWSAWSACSVTCENGTSTRTRTCTHPPALHAGKPCAGNDLETKPCSLPDCPGWEPWGPWSAWSACDMPCGTGQETRTRSCTTGNASDCTGPYVDFRTCETGVTCSLVDGTWKTWELWGACSRTCGGGERSRSRECVLPKFGGQFCLGDTLETEACSTQQCPVDGMWNTWGAWSQCNVTCGGGHQKRMRTCQPPQFGGNPCPGSAEESRVCNDFLCPEDGMWMPWSSWSSCTATCGGAATRSRERTCKTSLGSTKQCEGDSRQTESCSHGSCPIDGYWLQWQSWEDCNATCGGGTRQRVRQCQLGQYGGANCSGTAVDLQVCNLHECPVDGVWRPWGSWGSCSLTCGSGVRVRRRTCDGPSFGGRLCEGSSQESELCNVLACPVDGVWAAWAAWSACSQTCGDGWQERARDCQGPFHGGLNCSGPSSDSQTCFLRPCPVDGVWLAWTSWQPCPVTCGGGQTTRSRSCNGPFHGGHNCSGAWSEMEECGDSPCPFDGVWNPWSDWSACPVTCGGSTTTRSRTCQGPLHEGKNCSGSWKEVKDCGVEPCPVDGDWKPWGEWSVCSDTCGGGTQTRQRACLEAMFGGRPCTGPTTEQRSCNSSPCPEDGVFMPWSSWGTCDVTCGGGTRMRERTCDGPRYGGKNCSGLWRETEACSADNCPVDGVIGPWEAWTDCSVTCGGGSRSRYRNCTGPFHGGQPCTEARNESEACATDDCPVDGQWRTWSPWGDCSVSCGGGTRMRNRTCNGPFHGGRPCEGESRDSEGCNDRPCPVPGKWLPWATWSACSVTCGGGIRNRSRECDMTSYGDLTAPCAGPDSESETCHEYECTPLVRTCSEWGERGLRDSTVVEVDPDGEDLLDPVKVYCDMAADGGIGVTVIGHDNEDRIQVVGYEGAGEFSVVLNYNVTYFRHAEAIVDASDNCRQFIRWECKASLIHNPNGQGMVTTGWRNRTGEIADYFGGASPGSGKCACGMTRSCADPAQVCNCDKNDNVWREDSGFLTYKQDLPVKEFIAGDTGDQEQEEGYGTIGPLLCAGSSSL